MLNQDYLPAGLSFNLVYVNRVLEADWFENVTDEDFWCATGSYLVVDGFKKLIGRMSPGGHLSNRL